MQAFVSCCLAFPGRESGQTQIVIAANRLIERCSYRQRAYLEQQTFHPRVPNPRQYDSNDRRTCFVRTRTNHDLPFLREGRERRRYRLSLLYLHILFTSIAFSLTSTIILISQSAFASYITFSHTLFSRISNSPALSCFTTLLVPVTLYLIHLASHISSSTLRVAARRRHIRTLSCQR